MTHDLATAYIPVNIFDEFVFKPERVDPTNDNLTVSQVSDTPDSVVFEVPLDALLECLNIFGSGGPAGGSAGKLGGDFDDDGGRKRGGGGGGGRTVDLTNGSGTNGRLDQFFHPAPELRKTRMKMGYGGRGYPLCFILWVLHSQIS